MALARSEFGLVPVARCRWVGVVLLAAAGCGGPAANAPSAHVEEQPSAAVAAANASGDSSRCEYKGRLDREARESASLGSVTPNVRRVYSLVGQGEERRKVLLCREVDTNLDGIKDVVRTFNDKGESLREIADADYDGKVDTWVTFARGRMAKVEFDGDHDGQPDEWRYYVQGKLSRLQRDTNKDNKPDVWEIYEDGHLRRMGHDLDFDGHVDRWDRDEVAERAALEKELAEEERQKAAAKAAEAAESGDTPAKPGSSAKPAASSAAPGVTGKPEGAKKAP